MAGHCGAGSFQRLAEDVDAAARRRFEEVIRKSGSDRKGCFVFFKAFPMGDEISPFEVGVVPPEKKTKYSEFSKEKVIRARENYLTLKHLTSYESRDPDHDKWGGGVLSTESNGKQFGIGTSGLTEHEDECVSLLTAVDCGFMSMAFAKTLALKSGNHLFLDTEWEDIPADPETAESIAVDVVREFVDSVMGFDLWSYDEAGLFEHEEQLETSAVARAQAAGLPDEKIALTKQCVSMMFWRWIGRREGWESKEKGGPNPHEKFPWRTLS